MLLECYNAIITGVRDLRSVLFFSAVYRGVKRSGAHDSQVERMLACCPFGAHGAQINFKKV